MSEIKSKYYETIHISLENQFGGTMTDSQLEKLADEIAHGCDMEDEVAGYATQGVAESIKIREIETNHGYRMDEKDSEIKRLSEELKRANWTIQDLRFELEKLQRETT